MCKLFCIFRRVVIFWMGEGNVGMLFFGVCLRILYYQIYRHKSISAKFLPVLRDFYATIFLSDCSRLRTSLGSWPINIFPCAIIAQPCLLTRWRASLTEIRNHLSRMAAGRHEGFCFKETKTRSLFFFSALSD